jgi:two-component system OmpR family response regulator
MEILIIEDDKKIAEFLFRYLSQYANITHLVYPLAALNFLEKQHFDIVILDLSLPQLDGLEVCRLIKSLSDAKIIISSARSNIDDKLYALENGADDYLPKPYDPRELYARIKLLYKRETSTPNIKNKRNSDFQIDTDLSIIKYQGEKLNLTKAEYEIMQLFINTPNKPFSRIDLAHNISAHRYDSGLQSISVLVGRLRKKIEKDYQNPRFIVTVRGFGYKFNE